MSYRRLGVLIAFLPEESATKTAMRDDLTEDDLADLAETAPAGHGVWSRTDFRLANIEDSIRILTWTYRTAHGSKDKPPEPVKRPGVSSEKKRLTMAQREYLENIRRGRQEVESSPES